MRVVPRENSRPLGAGVFYYIFFASSTNKELTVLEDDKVKLLKAMEQNNKISTRTLATMLNIPEKEVEEMIKELEGNNVILGYLALIDWEKTNNNSTVTAMIDVQVTPQRDVGFDVIAARICRFPEVKSVTLMSGVYDLSVIVEGGSMKEVALFVAEKLATLENVQSTATHFVLKKYKKDGIIFNEDKKDHRLVISP